MVFKRFHILKSTKQRICKAKFYGFDIETYDKNKKFLCASIVGENPNDVWFFKNKQELIDFLKTKRFQNSIISATNLSFDFFGLFNGSEDIKGFDMLFRGSDLIFAKTYIRNKKFHKKYTSGAKRVLFLDTYSYAQLSVEKLGKIIGIQKLSKPKFLGHKPRNTKEWQIIKDYNIQDSRISMQYMKFLKNNFEKLGATFKMTIASTSMSLFKNKYLHADYFRASPDELLEQFNAYYGGRTEAFCRGLIKDYNYYDVNSLYPFVMKDHNYPDPNTKRITYKNTMRYIQKYEGISKVNVILDKEITPILPYRFETKLIFPTGEWTAWYSHAEIRKAITLGYKFPKVWKTYYYKKTCQPFNSYITDLYKKRLEHKAEGSVVEMVDKLLMNSLYGKFGQKFINRDNWLPFTHTLEELNKLKWFERVGDFIRIKKDFTEPADFCIPIWALYVTAYARMHLYDLIVKTNPAYVDTDSLITQTEMKTGKELGELKQEFKISHGIICKPKMYALVPTKEWQKLLEKKDLVKIKGIAKKLSFNEFGELLKNPKVSYIKFMKFKESIRRGFTPNELQEITKNLDLEDTKRIWKKKFNPKELQESKPNSLSIIS